MPNGPCLLCWLPAASLSRLVLFLTVLWGGGVTACRGAEPARLIGHWPLAGDVQDASGNSRHGIARGVDLKAADHLGRPSRAAGFDGRGASIEIPLPADLFAKSPEFTFCSWVELPDDTSDLPGSIASRFDFANRRGFHLGISTNTGVTTNQPNFRQLEFGIDAGHDDPAWIDHGRPGNANLVFALCVHNAALYAGTCEPAVGQAGHVYRHVAGTDWVDCGAPDRCNSVSALATFENQLYAGVSKYRLAGSALAESENPHLGGKIYRYAGGQTWVDCGQIPQAQAIGGLVVFRNRLYATSLYKPAGFYVYEGEQTWKECALPDGKRVEALAVWNGALYAGSYDLGHVFRFDGESWADLGQVGDSVNTQTYSFAVYRGDLYVGTWASGKVFRYGGEKHWIDCGRLGQELEVMGMLVHNGQLYAGTLPLAEVYRYAGGETWNKLVQLDQTPDVKYRRAWTMAQYRGRLYCGTLPSGRVWSFAAGATATDDRELKPGWHHVAAVRERGRLRLVVDGKEAAESAAFEAATYPGEIEQPLRLGAGPGDWLLGKLRDVRLYAGVLEDTELRSLADVPGE